MLLIERPVAHVLTLASIQIMAFIETTGEIARGFLAARAQPGSRSLMSASRAAREKGTTRCICSRTTFRAFAWCSRKAPTCFAKTSGELLLARLSLRAEALRVKARRWKEAGFETGPFRTYSRIEGGFGADEDGWASSVAVGRRYRLDPPPQIASLRTDLAAMLEIYRELASTLGAIFTEQDEALSALASSDGIPPGGLDGARCEGCALDLHRIYPDHWEGLIEAHHKRPLSQAPREGEQLSVDDFALLCPTCHRLIHRMGCPDLPRFVALLPLEVRQWHLKENF